MGLYTKGIEWLGKASIWQRVYLVWDKPYMSGSILAGGKFFYILFSPSSQIYCQAGYPKFHNLKSQH
jgi:hypothetical protein